MHVWGGLGCRRISPHTGHRWCLLIFILEGGTKIDFHYFLPPLEILMKQSSDSVLIFAFAFSD